MSSASRLPRPRKRFGQHFLHDRSVIERIVAALAPAAGEHVVEIGPGRGALTALLARAVAQRGAPTSLDVVEIDRDLAGNLSTEFAAEPRFTVHQADVLRFDFTALAHTLATGPSDRSAGGGGSGSGGQARLRVVGNLPYNISTPLLFHLLEHRAVIEDLHVMLQKEVIDRIVAQPGTREYGRLTIMLAPWLETRRLFDVGPGAFSPPPQVWSSVARLTVRGSAAFVVSPSFGKLVLAAFTQRRKTLRNALRTVVEPELLERLGIDPGARPDTLAPASYAALARAVDGL